MIRIKGERKITLPLYNGGVNESNISMAKEQTLMEAFRTKTELLNVKKHYPLNDILEIDISLDVVVLSNDEYIKLKKLANEFIQ